MHMTEDQIEFIAEKQMDALDRRLMSGSITQADYDAEVAALDAWTKNQQRQVHRR